MRDELTAVVLSQKAGGITAAISPLLAWGAEFLGWLDLYMVKLTAVASFILILVMIVSHICSTIRQNRESRLNVLLMQKKLREVDNELDP